MFNRYYSLIIFFLQEEYLFRIYQLGLTPPLWQNSGFHSIRWQFPLVVIVAYHRTLRNGSTTISLSLRMVTLLGSWRRGLAVGRDLDIVSLSFFLCRAGDMTGLQFQTRSLGWACPNDHNAIQSSVSQHSSHLCQSLWPYSCIIHMITLIQKLTTFFLPFLKKKTQITVAALAVRVDSQNRSESHG